MLDYLKSRGCRIGGVTLGERGLVWYDETGVAERFQLLPCRRIVFSIRVAPVMPSTALTSIPTSPMQRRAGRSISASPALLPPTRSNISATRQDCQLLPTLGLN